MKIAIHSMIRDLYKPYLTEWLNHHRSIGVDHFFIYDNDSKESIKDDKDVTVETIHGKSTQNPTGTSPFGINLQMKAYNKFLSEIQEAKLPHFDLVAFIDDDEFIICKNGNLKTTMEMYRAFPALGMSWRIFGSSGLMTQTPESQMKKFTKHTDQYYHSNINMKCIVNPYLVKSAINPHEFSYHIGNCVNEHNIVITGSYTYPSYDSIWINHYWTRSREEWIVKSTRGQADTGQLRRDEWFEEVNRNCIKTL